jgi:ribokinase
MTIENYKKCNVNIDYIQRVSGSSGVAPIWVEEDGTNRIIVISGANDLLDAESAISSMHSIQNLSVVVGQFEIPQNVTSEVFSYCKKNNIQTVLNPAPAQELDQDILDVTDWFIPNEVEFNFLSKGGDSNNDSDVLSFASDIPSNLIITLGAHGSAIVKKNKVVRFPAPEADVIDTTGAGDAFVGALAYGIACGLDIIESIQLGMDKASDSVTRKGTQSSFK